MSRDDVERLTGALGFIALVGAYFLFGIIPAMRVLGFTFVACGAFWFVSGKIPYGIKGHAPIGHLQGVSARLIAAVMIALGAFMLANATSAACTVGWIDGAACT